VIRLIIIYGNKDSLHQERPISRRNLTGTEDKTV